VAVEAAPLMMVRKGREITVTTSYSPKPISYNPSMD
jgi:hypothetical protein